MLQLESRNQIKILEVIDRFPHNLEHKSIKRNQKPQAIWLLFIFSEETSSSILFYGDTGPLNIRKRYKKACMFGNNRKSEKTPSCDWMICNEFSRTDTKLLGGKDIGYP